MRGSTSRGLQQLPSPVDVVPSGFSNTDSSVFLEHEPTLVMPKSTSGSRRVRRTRAQDKLEHGEWLCRDLGRRLRDMFEEQEGDQWDLLCSFMKANNFHRLAKKGESAFDARVRRIKVNRIAEQAADPSMVGKILGFNGNKNIRFIADTGTPVAIVPKNLALQNRVNGWVGWTNMFLTKN